MENNYQQKKENIIDKNKLRKSKRKNERPGKNNQNRGYLNIFKSKENIALSNNKNDFKRKNSKPSDIITRSSSEPNINQRNRKSNINLEKKLKMNFLKLKL